MVFDGFRTRNYLLTPHNVSVPTEYHGKTSASESPIMEL